MFRREDENRLSSEENQNRDNSRPRSPTGPWVAPPRIRTDQLPPPPPPSGPAPQRRWQLGSIAIFVLLLSGVGIQAWRDLSRPDAWDYWKDQYISPTLTASLVAKTYLGGSDQGRRTLMVSGTIGPAAAKLFRDRLDEAGLAAGDLVLLASPGGDLNQAVIIGEIIRSRALATAVGTADATGRVKPAYCASACVIAYAGGKPRFGVPGSALGVQDVYKRQRQGDA